MEQVDHAATPPYLIGSSTLFIDVDHALLRTDPLHERLFTAVKTNPLLILRLPVLLARGRQALIGALPGGFSLSACPRHPHVEHLVADARAQGKQIVWLTRETLHLDQEDPEFVALLEGELDGPEAGEPADRGEAHAVRLKARHPQGFAYVGGVAADLPLWRAARERYGVNLSPSLRRQAAREGLDIVELARAKPVWLAILRSMRPHQWLKNLLVFVPFALALGLLGEHAAARAVLAFACLCLLTSGSYLINDLFDMDADRRHPRKRKRPIASGDVPITVAVGSSLGLIGLALIGAAILKPVFLAALLCYLGITLAYSFKLKRMAMVDVLVIAMLFTLRILAGMLLVSETPSHWLLMFSIFFFLSLAFMKREVEFNVMQQRGQQALQGRGYAMEDRMYVLSCGLSSGMASIVIFSLFITETLDTNPGNYGAPVLLWGVMAFVSYWILRMWLLTTRGLMNDDPILFAARDRTSLLLGGASAVLVLCAQVLRF